MLIHLVDISTYLTFVVMIAPDMSEIESKIKAYMSQLVIFNISHVTHQLTRRTNRELTKLGYSLQFEQLPVLFITYFAGDSLLSQQEIANELQRDKSGIQRSIRTLERDGYLRVVADETDRRKNLIQLTPAGKLIVEKVLEEAAKFDRQLTDQMTADELKVLMKILQKVNQVLA